MATRAYRRDSNGRFAGSGGGTKVTYGKAGGFANAGFRARVAASRAAAGPKKQPGQQASLSKSLGATAGVTRRSGGSRTLKRAGVRAVTGAVGVTAAAAALSGRPSAARVAVAAAGAVAAASAARPSVSAGAKRKGGLR